MKSRHHLFFLLLVIFSFVVIFISTDIREVLFKHTRIDSIGHLIGFFCLTWLLHSGLKIPLLNTSALMIFYSALTEICQYYLGFRNGEVRDFIADIVGVMLFIFLKWLTLVYGKKHQL